MQTPSRPRVDGSSRCPRRTRLVGTRQEARVRVVVPHNWMPAWVMVVWPIGGSLGARPLRTSGADPASSGDRGEAGGVQLVVLAGAAPLDRARTVVFHPWRRDGGNGGSAVSRLAVWPRSFIPLALSVAAADGGRLVLILSSGCDSGPSVVSGGRRFQGRGSRWLSGRVG